MLVRAQREERLQVSGRLAGVRRREGRGDLFNTAVAEGARSQPPKPGAQPGEYPQYASTAAGGSRAQILAEAAGGRLIMDGSRGCRRGAARRPGGGAAGWATPGRTGAVGSWGRGAR